MATTAQWEAFENEKEISNKDKREMKYNLLPDVYADRFNELEMNWTGMSNSKFLSEAQKCKTTDKKEKKSPRKLKKPRGRQEMRALPIFCKLKETQTKNKVQERELSCK